MMGNIRDALPWYAGGLRFECQPNCGRCCHTGEVGPTLVGSEGEHDAEQLAKHVGMGGSLPLFIEAYTVPTPYRYPPELGRMVCIKAEHGHCWFLGMNQQCQVYDGRPRQCRAYPWFDSTLQSEATWAKARELCPGIGQGRLWSAEEIEEARATVHWEIGGYTLGM